MRTKQQDASLAHPEKAGAFGVVQNCGSGQRCSDCQADTHASVIKLAVIVHNLRPRPPKRVSPQKRPALGANSS